jgi:hypothetical protein
LPMVRRRRMSEDEQLHTAKKNKGEMTPGRTAMWMQTTKKIVQSEVFFLPPVDLGHAQGARSEFESRSKGTAAVRTAALPWCCRDGPARLTTEFGLWSLDWGL